MTIEYAARLLLTLAIAAMPTGSPAVEETPPPNPDAHVAVVKTLVEAFEAEDQKTWNAQFSERVRGRQPDELWQSAAGLISKFGKIEKIELARWDTDSKGAYVKLTFETATRELFVRMEEGKVRQLDYVPPTSES